MCFQELFTLDAVTGLSSAALFETSHIQTAALSPQRISQCVGLKPNKKKPETTRSSAKSC